MRSVMRQSVQADAVMVLVCTDRGQHREQVIEVLERDGGPGGHWSEGWASAKGAYDAVLSERLNRGAQLDDKLVERNGRLESRHRGGVHNTRNGAEAVCQRCHRRYPFRGQGFYRGLDAAVECGQERIDLSLLRRG